MAQYKNFQSKTPNPHFENVMDIHPNEISADSSTVRLIDVRRPDEFTGELGHIAGADLIVLDTLPEHISTLPKDQTVVFVCRSGGRSAQAAAYAKSQGFSEVYNMLGGMILWNELQLPTER